LINIEVIFNVRSTHVNGIVQHFVHLHLMWLILCCIAVYLCSCILLSFLLLLIIFYCSMGSVPEIKMDGLDLGTQHTFYHYLPVTRYNAVNRPLGTRWTQRAIMTLHTIGLHRKERRQFVPNDGRDGASRHQISELIIFILRISYL